MLHLLIDSCIYRADRKRNKPAFRAVLRLARAAELQLHVPAFVKGEVLSQQQRDIRADLNKLTAAAEGILRTTAEENLQRQANAIVGIARCMTEHVEDWLTTELQAWLADAKGAEHPVHPTHGKRVAAAYFAGGPPFRTAKHRDDFPDAFIWETALDLVAAHGKLVIVSADGRLRQAAEAHEDMTAYESLDELIEDEECQDALDELTPEIIAENIERIKTLLPGLRPRLIGMLENDIVNELAWKTVTHESIPDDNNEGTITLVGGPEEVEFKFDEIDHYGDAEIGIPFTANVECALNYAIFKGNFYSLPDMRDISISERNDHYFDADEGYTIKIEGYLTLTIDTEELGMDDVTDENLGSLIEQADHSTDVTDLIVNAPQY